MDLEERGIVKQLITCFRLLKNYFY